MRVVDCIYEMSKETIEKIIDFALIYKQRYSDYINICKGKHF